ncbi:SDR family oxidoreductase [Neorhodopirellula pilleata]|uniref:Putative oxidoreductase SadH n=1 Tax=Neorhodopirellula pilleata TaxID=2714738 RepID=A0A5C6AMV4_9BACT|nr:SDR family oxidoreductase [Neorhodopirellula pilleata]TWU01383.1 putative oxidoreductase SadH [Neorhodopirellula pilleata]
MNFRPKNLNEQTIVITGASSGIGLATAREAASQGAQVVLVSRDESALRQVVEELQGAGGDAIAVTADVGDPDAVNAIAESAIAKYGGFDTWVNNAGVSIYGLLDEVPVEDHRRLFETNFWGTVYGSLAALPHLKDNGGTLVNVGSVLSERAIPLQGMYSASKHAVKGFTDALRTEMMHAKLPVNVTLIKPSGIDTPYVEHARNYTHKAATLPAPVYDPSLVADGILSCATTYRRELTIGEQKAYEWLEATFPGLADRMIAQTSVGQQQLERPPRHAGDNLFSPPPVSDPQQRGEYTGYTMPISPYTSIAKHPLATLAILGGVLVGLGALTRVNR